MLRYAITDRSLFAGDEAFLAACRHVAAEADFLQLRERDWTASQLEDFGRQLSSASDKLLINHRLDVALALGCGIHLRSGAGEVTPEQAREAFRLAGQHGPVVSASCHTVEEVAAARSADIILFGPVFGKQVGNSQIAPPAGLELLRAACEAAAPAPVLALGGVTAGNAPECLEAGAAGVAGIRMFFAPQAVK